MVEKLFNSYGFNFDKDIYDKFNQFLIIFKEKNNQLNLSSIKDDESIIEKHFIDSLMLIKYIQLSGRIADIGTGGGFPLIPLAIFDKIMLNNENGSQYFGIDSVAKKLKAVDDFSDELGLDNIETIHSRFEELGRDKNYRESFDYVVSRATSYFPTLLEFAIPLLKVGGVFIAYKMDNENEIMEGNVALIKLKSEIIYIKKYKLDEQKRSLVFVRKLEKTPSEYPRSSQLIARKPLI